MFDIYKRTISLVLLLFIKISTVTVRPRMTLGAFILSVEIQNKPQQTPLNYILVYWDISNQVKMAAQEEK